MTVKNKSIATRNGKRSVSVVGEAIAMRGGSEVKDEAGGCCIPPLLSLLLSFLENQFLIKKDPKQLTIPNLLPNLYLSGLYEPRI